MGKKVKIILDKCNGQLPEKDYGISIEYSLKDDGYYGFIYNILPRKLWRVKYDYKDHKYIVFSKSSNTILKHFLDRLNDENNRKTSIRGSNNKQNNTNSKQIKKENKSS